MGKRHELIDTTLNVFACPKCKGILENDSRDAHCRRCEITYPIVERVHCFLGADENSRQSEIYDTKHERGELLQVDAPTNIGRYPDLLLTYREHGRQVNRLKLPSSGRILEVGCSNGTFLQAFQRQFGLEPYGLDVSFKSVSAAARNVPSGRFGHATADALPFQDSTFDAVFAFDVLEHIHDYQGALKEISRVLRPQGHALLHVPVSDIRGTSDWIWKELWPERWKSAMDAAGHFPENMRTKNELLSGCQEAGLKIEHLTLFNVLLQNVFDYHTRHRFLARLFYGSKIFFGRRLPFSVYHALLAPLIECCTVWPDRVLARLTGIGASLYIHARPSR